MAITLGTGSLALLTLGVATTLLVSERPHSDAAGPRQDLTAPEVPTGLSALPVEGSSGTVRLVWEANHSDPDLAGYVVYRSDRPEGGYVAITPEPVLTNGYLDDAAPAGRKAFYRVSARDAARNESSLSALSSVDAPGTAGAVRLAETPRKAGI